MKLKCFILLMLTMLSINNLSAQNQAPLDCTTDMSSSGNGVFFSPMNNPVYSGSTDPAVLASYPQIRFNIYFWIINKNDGTSDYIIDEEVLLQNINRANELFQQMGICFVLKGYSYFNSPINDEGENYLYQGAQYWDIMNYANNHDYVIPNSFNVYIPKSLYRGNGQATPTGNQLAVNHGHILGIYGSTLGNTLAHELAHNFYLWHTFGIVGDVTTPEHVTRDPNDINYNALTTADYIHDTPAMISFRHEANEFHEGDMTAVIDANCNYIGNATDALGVPLDLTPVDVGNIMGYTVIPCVIGFTVGQGIRIREYIDGSPNDLSVQAMSTDSIELDLYIKDSSQDFGEEPNVSTSVFWNSSDIWVRNQPDNVIEHQNPEYDPNNPNYIYVRVTNRGCDTSTGNEALNVYWSKSATALSWDYNWAGNNFPDNGPIIGDLVGSVPIPVLAPGEQVILQLPWNVPDPADYTSLTAQPWHFCLLARIIAPGDPMTVAETNSITYNVSQNNNITGKNLTVVDLDPNSVGRPIGGAVAIGNVFQGTRAYNLSFVADNAETGKKIFEEAEVSVDLDNTLLNAWIRGGRKGTNFSIEKDRIVIKGNNAALDNIILDEDELGIIYLQFNFLTEEITNKERYIYNIIQTDNSTSDIIGGETYEIRKQPRTLFYANAGDDEQVDKNEEIVLSAEPISEPAIYNWYDNEGNLICEGVNFAVTTEVAKKYKLEVIALSDGYKDYTDVEISLKPNSIKSVSPNPSSAQIKIEYKINSGNSAYLSIVGFYNSGISNNYILDVEQDEVNVDISNYPQGLYTVSLITNGEVSDITTLIKE